MSNALNQVAPSFIGISYLAQALEMKDLLETFGAKFDLPENFEQNEDTFLELLPQLIEQFPLYFTKCGSDTEVESAFFSLISMIQLLSQVDQIEETSKKLSNAIVADTTAERQLLKARLLSQQFNCYQPSLRSTYLLLCNVLKLVVETGQLRHVTLDIDQISEWMLKWKCEVQEQRDVYRLLHEAFSAIQQGEKAIQALVRLLKLYSENEGVEAKSDAHICVISHIAHPKIFVMDHLLDLHPIRALDGQLSHELLQIFVDGDLNDYIEFYNNNVDFVEKLAVTHEENLRKMRLLTLASMAQDCSEIEFSQVIEKLNLASEELEPFVIEAIGSGLIKGKINEPEERISISSTINRTFKDPQWMFIKSKLEMWQKNLVIIQESMRKGHFAVPIGGG